MKQIHIAFDVDGTLIRNDSGEDMAIGTPVANERIRTLLIILASFKNTHITVWSGGGELYARQVVSALGLHRYVDSYLTKNMIGRDSDGHPMFEPEFKPDIAIDDIQACELGVLNLIVHEK